MILVIGSGGGGAVGSWIFNTASSLPAIVTPMTILAITTEAVATKYAGTERPTTPTTGDIWFWIDDPSAGTLFSDGATQFKCYGAYRYDGSAWNLLTSHMAWMGEWVELPSLPPIGTAHANCTWDQINRIGAAGKTADYFAVGDEKEIVTSTAESITLQIIGLAHDNLSSAGGGKAAITYCFKNCMRATQQMNPTNTNVGGYSGCALYPTITNTIYGTLPADLRAVMKQVNKLTSAGNQSGSIVTTQEKLFMLSEVEIFGSTTYAKSGEGTQYAFFTSGGARVKTVNGVASYWWERSPYGSGATYFCFVNSSGVVYYNNASYSYGVALGLCV